MPIDITGGKISFSRTVKVADYEPKAAAAELTFNVPEGEAFTHTEIDTLFDQARSTVYRALGIAPAAAPKAVDPVMGETKRVGRPPKAAAATAAAGSPATSAATVSEVDAIGSGPTQGSTAAAQSGAATGVTTATASPAMGAGEPMADFENPPAAEITDKLLLEHVTKKNQALKAPPKIHALVAEFAGPPPKTYKDVPQALRQQFLDRLQALA